jgi:hypothetical protein
VHVPKIIESGIFGIDGQPIAELDEEEDIQIEVEPVAESDAINEVNVEEDSTSEVPNKKMKLFYCDMCKKELSFLSNIEILRHKSSHINK